MKEMTDMTNKRVEAEEMIDKIDLKKVAIKAGAVIYMAVLTVVACYYITGILIEVFYDDIERTAFTAFISIAMFTAAVYLLIIEKSMIKVLCGYHFILLGTALVALFDIGNMPFMLVSMIISGVFGLSAGLVTAMCVGVTLTIGMLEFPLYILGSVIIVINVLSCFATGIFDKLYKNIMGVVGFFVGELVLLIYFKYYCSDYGFEYVETSFIVSMMVVAVISVVISNVIRIISDIFIKKRTPEFLLKKIGSEKYEAARYIKNKSTSLYYHSIEVAEMSRLAAKRIGANSYLAYAGGLYHDLGKTVGSEYIREGLKLADKYNIPRDVKSIMVEHNVKSRLPKSKEAAIVMLSDTAVSAIEYVKGTMDKKDISERAVMENALNKRLSTGALNKSGLTIEEFNIIRDTLVGIKENQ